MPLVEADRVAQRDGPRFVRLRPDPSKSASERSRLRTYQADERFAVQHVRVRGGIRQAHACKDNARFRPMKTGPGVWGCSRSRRGRAFSLPPTFPERLAQAPAHPDRLRPVAPRRPGNARPERVDRGLPADRRHLSAPGLREESRAAPPAHERGRARRPRERRTRWPTSGSTPGPGTASRATPRSSGPRPSLRARASTRRT